MFAESISQVLESLEDFLCQSFDSIAILLMIHMTQQHRQVMQMRRLACLDGYFDRVNRLLWPRFKAIFDLNLNSVRAANISKLGYVCCARARLLLLCVSQLVRAC